MERKMTEEEIDLLNNGELCVCGKCGSTYPFGEECINCKEVEGGV